jgi:TonB-linked SusC/RagA family outer membrane protein
METKEIDIANQSVIDVTLEEESTWLSEVVAVGYGIKQKKDLTGAVSVVEVEDISNIPVAGVDQMMQGRVAGVNIIGDYAPGGGVSVRVRGFSTVRNNDPLYIIDGVPVESGINMINPNDIESLQVLKDAASASIYGSRAANGVIIITTKKGSKEEATIHFDTYVGIQSAAKQLTPLSAQEYGDLLWEAHYNDGKTPANDIYGSGPSATIPQFLDASNKVPSTDLNWVDEIMQNALVQSHNLNISKGKDDSFYNLSLGYYNQEGIIKYTDFERVSVRFNSKSTFFDRLIIGENLSLAHSWSNRTTTNSVLGGVVYDAYKYPSIAPVYDVDGNFAGAFLSDIRNPLARLYHSKDNTYKQLKLFGNVFAELELIDGLVLKTNFGVDYGTNYRRNFNPKFQETGAHNPSTISTLSNNYSQRFEWVWTNTMNYSAVFDKHQVDVLAGMESIESTYEYFNASREGFPYEEENFRFLNAGDGGSQKNSGSGSRWSLISYMAKADYIYDQRYLASFTFRRDGSSKLGNNNWGNFPAFSLGWRVSEEDFFTTDKISNLKIRFGWGQNGNQDVPPYATIESYYSNPYYSNYAIDGAQTSVNNGFTQTRNGNIDLKWETTTQTNFGFDLGFLNNRLNITADYFIKNTTDLLLERPLPPIAGGTNQTVWDNVGEMQNKGFELLIDYQSKYVNNFSWNGSLNFSKVENELTSLPDDIEFIALPSAYLHSVNFDQETSRSMVGQPISSFFGYRSLGIFQNQSEIDAHKVQPNAQPGDLRFEDVDKDGDLDGDDRDFIGNPHPDFTVGLNLGAQYKNFDVSLFLNGTVGNDVWDLTRYYGDFFNLSAYNKLDRTLDAWSTENPNGTVPRLSLDDPNNNIRPSSYYISDASYLRLKTLTIGYTFNELAQKLKASNMRVYVQAQNLFTITGYEGLDPEVGLQSYSSEHRNLDIGVDRGLYPPSRTFMVGLNLNF